MFCEVHSHGILTLLVFLGIFSLLYRCLFFFIFFSIGLVWILLREARGRANGNIGYSRPRLVVYNVCTVLVYGVNILVGAGSLGIWRK